MIDDVFLPLSLPEGEGAPRRPRDESGEIACLKLEIERLLLLSEALWTILKEQHGFDDEELVRRMVTVDLKDGKLDGKVAKTPPSPCPKCKRPVAKRHIRCIYCGELVPPAPFSR
jgi:hypothetical protein